MIDKAEACRVCGGSTVYLWTAPLLEYSVGYHECRSCGYVQTEEPYWLEKAYEAPINESDTGILGRNLSNARIVEATLLAIGKLDGRVVDWAGGYGILVRLLRDLGINAFWSDPYSRNLLARGFEYIPKGELSDEKPTLVTAFEAFEHFVAPVEEFGAMLQVAPNALISTNLIPSPAPEEWWYYGSEHGQHIGFYRLQTLEHLAAKFGKVLISDGRSFHFFAEQKSSTRFWKLLMRYNKLVHGMLKWRLQSKTWDDHLALRSGPRY